MTHKQETAGTGIGPFYYQHPQTRLSLPDVHPGGSLLLTSAGCAWGASVRVEERRFTTEYDLGAFSLMVDTLSLMLAPCLRAEQMVDGSWHQGCQLPGEVMIRPACVESSGRWTAAALPPGGIRAVNVQLDPSFIAQAVPEAGAMELPFQFSKPDPQITRIVLALRDDLASGCPSGRLFGEGLAAALAAHLLARYAVHPVKLTDYRRGLGPADLRRVLDLIGDQLSDDLSLEDLAACCHLSPYHFSRLFKQSTGVSPYQYVIRQRVERAKSLLLRGGLTAGAVAQAVGFPDQGQLQRHFKRLVGTTPGQFRKGR
jgi:AraC family transcriptional regulator